MSQLIIKLDSGAKQVNAAGKNVYSAIASTAAMDRDNEVLMPKGCIAENFIKNPVMLYIHDYRQVPVGKVESLDVTDEAVKFTFTFNDTPDGKLLDGMYSKGEMNAFSVGFKSINSVWVDDQTPDILTFKYPDGSDGSLNLKSYSKLPNRVFTQWELLEISPVPVPANPEALIQRAKEDMIRKAFDGVTNAGAKQLIASRIEKEATEALELLKDFLKSHENSSDLSLNVIPYEKTEVTSEEWDPLAAKASILQVATSIEEEKEVISWSTYSKGFAFVTSSKADCVSSYKLPHHSVNEKGDFVLNEKGLYDAMADLLKDKSAYGEDAEKVYNHLKEHYSDIEKKAPELNKDYSEKEIDEIRSKGDVNINVTVTGSCCDGEGDMGDMGDMGGQPGSEMDPEDMPMMNAINDLTSKFNEFSELFNLKFRILSKTLDSIDQQVKSLNVEVKNTEEPPAGSLEDNTDEKVAEQLKVLKDFLGVSSETT